jgi:antitoxin CptB
MSDDLDVRRRRALYRAEHRGTKELDWLIGRYAAARLPEMDAAALARFEQLLTINEVELQKWLIEPDALVDTAFEADIYAIRAFHGIERRVN